MNERSVREQLAETRGRRRQIDEEAVILDSLITGFEGWLRLNSHSTAPEVAAPLTMAVNAPKGTISLAAAIRQVVEASIGRPLKTAEILERAQALGAITEAKSPMGVVDLHLAKMMKRFPLEKVGPRLWLLRSSADTGTSPLVEAGRSL